MPKLSINEIVKVIGGRISPDGAVSGTLSATGYAFDTRELAAGDLFFALKGERRDGHTFIADAHARGAVGAVVRRKVGGVPEGFVQIVVPSPLDALQRIAGYVRDAFDIPVVAISGSNGKTTTKDMLTWILTGSMRVRKSPGNFNNHIGVPVSILTLEETDEALIVEIGSNHRGEIRRLCDIARPTMGIVTNVGTAHIGHFGSVEAIALEKTDILRSLGPDGQGVINADDPVLLSASRDVEANLIGFGVKGPAEFRATEIRQAGGYVSFTVNDVPVRIAAPGVHNVYNATAAVAGAALLGIPAAEAARRLVSFEPMRMKITAHEGLTLIDDSYNANPDSVRAALAVACALDNPRKVFVMGEMLELGDDAERLHRQIGSSVASSDIDVFVGIGGLTRAAVDEARASGMPPERALYFDDKAKAKEHLGRTLQSHDLVLVKGSRMTGLDEISDFLRREAVEGRI
jgi:UDP-N-acetylmuramoyl-tripeptide--D-alanyl-D-alanine ligase